MLAIDTDIFVKEEVGLIRLTSDSPNKMHDSVSELWMAPGYSRAWEKPFDGLSRSFTEYEILKFVGTGKFDSIIDIYNALVIKYPNLKKSKSQIYRIIENLESEGLIHTNKDGKNKRLELTDVGFQEIGNLMRYVFDFLREKVILEGLWEDILEMVVPQTGCIRSGQTVFAGPIAYGINILWNSCKRCDLWNGEDETQKSPIFLALPDSDLTQPPFEKNQLQVLETPNPYDWLPKAESTDLFTGISLITKFGSKILEEVWRILKPNAHALFIEPVKTTPNIILLMYNHIIALNKIETAKRWTINKRKDKLFTREELKEMLEQQFSEVKAFSESLMKTFIVRK
ncbi:MAG: hypothetical protein D6732_07860 [Methanobacteriota archaeon]|nr:MAG: hypothetical protein D6732_07860 [Euryarchaeota archaeon]